MKYQIKKIPICKYPELLKQVKILPTYFSGMAGKSNAEIVVMLPDILANCLPDVIAVLAEATDIKKEELEQMDFYEISKVFIEVIKINRFRETADLLKKELAPKPAEKI
jgi:hypothetical protein